MGLLDTAFTRMLARPKSLGSIGAPGPERLKAGPQGHRCAARRRRGLDTLRTGSKRSTKRFRAGCSADMRKAGIPAVCAVAQLLLAAFYPLGIANAQTQSPRGAPIYNRAIGACIWRELDPETKAALRAASKNSAPFIVVWQLSVGSINTYSPTKVCDPAYASHWDQTYLNWRLGIIEGLSLEMLLPSKITQAELDRAWRADTDLRGCIARIAEELASPGNPERINTGCVLLSSKTALSGLGLAPAEKFLGGSPEAAALSYWWAQGLSEWWARGTKAALSPGGSDAGADYRTAR